MKVTVIATGFPTDMPKRSLFQINQKKEELESEDKKEDKEENSSQYIKKNDKNKEVEDDLFVDDTDEWSTVPAFLRRNKK
jgi:hypothetical protein